MAISRRSTPSNLEVLRPVLEGDLIAIIDGDHDGHSLAHCDLTSPRGSFTMIPNLPSGLEVYTKLKRRYLLEQKNRAIEKLPQAEKKCRVAESNHGHEDFQSSALPTELTRHPE